ncbi:MAG: thiamine phosphate synthase [Gemmataceae bacterium]
MLPTLTPAVSRAIEAAAQFLEGAPARDPLHLLHGLLDEEFGAAAALAMEAGLDYDRYRASRSLQPGADDAPLSSTAESLLYRAREIAFDLTGEGVVSSEALLLALVRHAPEVEANLRAGGMQPAQLDIILGSRRPPALPLDDPLQLADLTERMEIGRILDAGFNRAREALRVVEDYCRFALDDAFLSSLLKEIRHDLTAAFEELAPPTLLSARETEQDVGTQISTEREYERASLFDVVRANLKRLEEALRSLEEFAKVPSPLLAERIERLRYRSYTAERAILLGARAREMLRDARLYVLLSGASCVSSLEWTIAEAAAGGAGIIQLREKSLPDRDLICRAREVRQWTRKAGVLFIMNDRPDIARLVEADGVHLGQDDLSVKDVRKVIGPDALIGVSTHSPDQLRQAILDGASYVGVGPVFPSGTKAFSEFAGLDYVRQAMAITSLPAFAIGGIHPGTLASVLAAGATRVAVSGAIAGADDPRRVASELLAEIPSIRRGAS